MNLRNFLLRHARIGFLNAENNPFPNPRFHAKGLPGDSSVDLIARKSGPDVQSDSIATKAEEGTPAVKPPFLIVASMGEPASSFSIVAFTSIRDVPTLNPFI